MLIYCVLLMQALIWSKMSTGLPIEISSSMKAQSYISFCRLDIDIHRYDSNLGIHRMHNVFKDRLINMDVTYFISDGIFLYFRLFMCLLLHIHMRIVLSFIFSSKNKWQLFNSMEKMLEVIASIRPLMVLLLNNQEHSSHSFTWKTEQWWLLAWSWNSSCYWGKLDNLSCM